MSSNKSLSSNVKPSAANTKIPKKHATGAIFLHDKEKEKKLFEAAMKKHKSQSKVKQAWDRVQRAFKK